MTMFDDVVDRDMLHQPFDNAAADAEEALEKSTGNTTVFQVFECGHCGVAAQTMEPNVFHETGRCSECGKDTDLRESGCTFAVFIGPPEDVIKAVADSVCGRPGGNA